MNDTLTLNKLEKLIEVESKLRSEYQQQLDAKDATISQLNNDKAALEVKLTELGMLTNPGYKIAFALDKTSMFSIISTKADKSEFKHQVRCHAFKTKTNLTF